MAAVMAGYLSAHAKDRMSMWRRSNLPLQMLGGLVLGLIVGVEWPSVGKALQPIGTAFIQAIQMIVIPLIFSAVSLGVYRMGENARQLGRVAIVAFGWFYVATLFAVLVALGLNGLFHPGRGANLVGTGSVSPNLALSIDWTKYLLDLIPTNIVAAMAAQRVLPTLVFAVLFGLGLARIGRATARPKRSWRRCSALPAGSSRFRLWQSWPSWPGCSPHREWRPSLSSPG
jgi:dicarboxylate/amino acid:cation (Na+ or H+) symporter, DAACS family